MHIVTNSKRHFDFKRIETFSIIKLNFFSNAYDRLRELIFLSQCGLDNTDTRQTIILFPIVIQMFYVRVISSYILFSLIVDN